MHNEHYKIPYISVSNYYDELFQNSQIKENYIFRVIDNFFVLLMDRFNK